jgi:lactate permease
MLYILSFLRIFVVDTKPSTMQLALYSLLALAPILTAFLLLVVANRPATQAMPVAYLVTAIIAMALWKVPFIQVAASTIEGLIVTLEILYIVFGAILLLNTLQGSGAISKIRQGLLDISQDRRIQVIVIAWLFGSFLEGASGFGSTPVIIVPLLVSIGFPAMAAVIAAMLIQTTATAFGAVGTPIIIGINSGLEGAKAVEQEIARLGLNFADYLDVITIKTALMQGAIGLFIPLLLILVMTAYFGERRSWKEALPAAGFALFAGLAFVIPYVLTAVLIGPEFPSLVGALVGLAIVVPAAKRGFLTPKQTWDFPEPAQWSPAWLGTSSGDLSPTPVPMTSLQAWTPYLLVGVFLALSRLRFLPLRQWLQSAQIDFLNILGTNVSISTQPLFLPGTVFIVVAICAYFLHQMQAKQMKQAIAGAAGKLLSTALAIGASVPMAKVFINSDVNTSGLASMPLTLADGVSSLLGPIWPFFAPVVGMIGTFVSGSATVSNMMFSLFQFGVAEQIGASASVILALQCVGATAGNIIAVANIVPAVATVGLLGREGRLLRQLLLPMMVYLLLAGTIGVLAIFMA